MNRDPRIFLDLAAAVPAGFERDAVDPDGAGRERTARFLASFEAPAGVDVYPWGLDGAALWDPWRRAREAVERLPQDPQVAGARADFVLHDRAAGTVTLGKVGLWTPGCPRFQDRQCPRMATMGHESPHADCNYWAWAPMPAFAPGVELFPEWQRFDCSRYYPLFQLHLCGEELADLLEVEPRWSVHAPEEAAKWVQAYAALTSRPDAFLLSATPEP